MSQNEHKFIKDTQIKSWASQEITIPIPFYGKYHLDYSTVYIKIDKDLDETSITINDDCITDSGYHQNFSVEIEFEKPHGYGYACDFYENNKLKQEQNKKEYEKEIECVIKMLKGVK